MHPVLRSHLMNMGMSPPHPVCCHLGPHLWVCPLCTAYTVTRAQGHLMLLCGIAFIPRTKTGAGQKDSPAGSDCIRSRGHISISCVSLVCFLGAGGPLPFLSQPQLSTVGLYLGFSCSCIQHFTRFVFSRQV